jgi:hypothetical protein
MAIVNAAGSASGSSVTSHALTIPSTANGNTLIAIWMLPDGGDPNLPTDNLGQTWSWAYGSGAGGERVYIAYRAATGAGVTTVTFGSVAASFVCCEVVERDDINTTTVIHGTPVLDLFYGPITAGNAITSSAVTSSVADIIGVYGVMQYTNGTGLFTKGASAAVASGTGITTGNVANPTNGSVLFAQFELFSTTGSKTGTCTNAATVGGCDVFVLFNAQSAAGGNAAKSMNQRKAQGMS